MGDLLNELAKLHAPNLNDTDTAYRLGFKHGQAHVLDKHFGTPCEQIRHQHEVDQQAAQIKQLETRLEISHVYELDRASGEMVKRETTPEEKVDGVDGIFCRDTTISGQKIVIASLRKRIEELEGKFRRLRDDSRLDPAIRDFAKDALYSQENSK